MRAAPLRRLALLLVELPQRPRRVLRVYDLHRSLPARHPASARHLVIKYLTVEDLGERRECEEELRKLGLSEGDLEQLKAYAKAIMDEHYRERAAEMRERLAGR